MTVSHAQAGDVIDVRPFGCAFDDAKTSVLLHTDFVKAVRVVMPAGNVLSEHKAPGEIIVHCLEGKIEFTTMGETKDLNPGQLLSLPTGNLHSVKAIENSSFLLTIVSTVP